LVSGKTTLLEISGMVLNRFAFLVRYTR